MHGRIAVLIAAFLGAVFLLIARPGLAQNEQRVALVIGNSAYKESPLANPGNDAADMAKALTEAGFKVILRRNASTRAMREAVREFGSELRRAQVGLFYYAGHGVQVRGNNYLIPVAADIRSEADVEDQAVDANYVLRTMEEAQVKVNIVILDACRNNPYASGFRSASRGLAQMTAATGTVIAFSTAPGSIAADGSGRNGLYTQHLLASLRQSDTDILKVFQRTRAGVVRDTGGKQTPWESTSLTGDFYFRPGTHVASAASSAVQIAAPAPTLDAEVVFWDSMKSSTNPADFQAYLDQYPDGRFAALARNRVKPAPAPQAPTQVASVQPTLGPSAPPVLSGSYNVAPDSSFPSRPIRIVVPFPPGGASDVVGRVIASSMAGNAGQPVIIENRPGGGGTIGTMAVAKSAPDGYTLLMASTGTQAIAPGIYSKLPYDANRDFSPVAIISESPQVLVVPSSGPASVQDLISRARGGQFSFASGGSGTLGHLAAELFRARTGTNLVHVPYKGTGPALTDLIGGQVQLMFADPASVVPQINAGRLRALAVTGQQRNPQLGNVPTLAESGVSGVEASSWYGLLAPAGTPGGVVSRLYQLIRQSVSTPDVANRLSSLGMIARVLPPNDTQVFVRSEIDKWGQVARAAGVRAD